MLRIPPSHPDVPDGSSSLLQQWHEIRCQTLDGLCLENLVVSREFQGDAKIFECEGVVGAAHPLAGRTVIAPANGMAKNDFHCTRITARDKAKLQPAGTEQNQGGTDKVVT